MLLRNRKLLLALLAGFTLIQAWLSVELMRDSFDWRPLWGASIVRATVVDFAFTVVWCAFSLLDDSRRRGRAGWAWIPLLLILPTLALLLYSLTDRDPRPDSASPAEESPRAGATDPAEEPRRAVPTDPGRVP